LLRRVAVVGGLGNGCKFRAIVPTAGLRQLVGVVIHSPLVLVHSADEGALDEGEGECDSFGYYPCGNLTV